MKPIDLLDRTTHRNWAAPNLDSSLVQALTDIVGLNPYGEPNARFAWGMSTMRFQWGKDRLAYVDTRIPAIRHTRHTLKRVKLIETKTMQKAVGIADGMIEYHDVVQEIPHYERKILTEAPKIVPAGWLYELELVALEWVGEQLFALEQWYPPDHFGLESTWNRNRWRRWPFEWAPEFDVQVLQIGEIDTVKEDEDGIKHVQRLRGEIVDAIGPFPAKGAYRSLRFLGEPYEYERPILVGPKGHQIRQFIRDTHLSYRAPGRDTLDAIREAWADREQRREYSAEELGKMRFDNYTEAEDKATTDSAHQNYEELEDRRKKIQVGYGS